MPPPTWIAASVRRYIIELQETHKTERHLHEVASTRASDELRISISGVTPGSEFLANMHRLRAGGKASGECCATAGLDLDEAGSIDPAVAVRTHHPWSPHHGR